ncbi:hypothetical protein G7067_09650 [Leucobacter insecticola]|uniref:Knr4/Smi1-like domain-containing protein n=1 Tax=Leucobacter insecticola TaxID=2714934 RepID=A0A6G8FJH4_9MICO|nr:YrhA family protein [Leucobacter insecticola]QIM16610.1 hypothetical protein G7067_09650 [Leucobacter insecticola]
MNWNDCLNRLNEVNEKYGHSAPPPAKKVYDFLSFARSRYGLFIPVEFAEFWKLQNGLEFDGNVFYHVDESSNEDIDPSDVSTNNSIIATNAIWRENEGNPRYTFLGDGNIDWYVYDTESGRYLVLDKSSAEIMETFDNFEEFFTTVLTQMVEQI